MNFLMIGFNVKRNDNDTCGVWTKVDMRHKGNDYYVTKTSNRIDHNNTGHQIRCPNISLSCCASDMDDHYFHYISPPREGRLTIATGSGPIHKTIKQPSNSCFITRRGVAWDNVGVSTKTTFWILWMISTLLTGVSIDTLVCEINYPKFVSERGMTFSHLMNENVTPRMFYFSILNNTRGFSCKPTKRLICPYVWKTRLFTKT